MGADYGRGLYKEYALLLTQKEAARAEYKLLKKKHRMLKNELIQAKKQEERMNAELAEKAAENDALKKENLRLSGLLNIDGTNSGLPTSKTPISKKKIIPNSRKKSGKKIGGQPGHPKSKLKAFADDEVTETETYNPESCPSAVEMR